ncbi:hypothetical protein FRX31_019287 [Thalictrum thalictroides]|uniref:Uncharacterized protein n=1 Tax=Thalictrum thalictroides TaxID=46969 RepID=A0A7J6W481_THATH|nr:hypothetical protein FRX31_019287 [Thalictrum thalictroides]
MTMELIDILCLTVLGMTIWEYLEGHPDQSQLFNEGKENFSPPCLCRSPVSLNSSLNPLHPNIVNRNSHGKPLKFLFKEGLLLHHHIGNDGIRDVCKIDAEMEEIETEIGRLSLKLESLRLEKKEMNGKQVERIDQK